MSSSAEKAIPQSAFPTFSQERELKDVAWVAKLLGVSKSWVYQAAANGVLPVVRIGALLRFDKRAMKKWLDGDHSSPSVKLPSCR